MRHADLEKAVFIDDDSMGTSIAFAVWRAATFASNPVCAAGITTTSNEKITREYRYC